VREIFRAYRMDTLVLESRSAINYCLF
jgi:hypothetical protein